MRQLGCHLGRRRSCVTTTHEERSKRTTCAPGVRSHGAGLPAMANTRGIARQRTERERWDLASRQRDTRRRQNRGQIRRRVDRGVRRRVRRRWSATMRSRCELKGTKRRVREDRRNEVRERYVKWLAQRRQPNVKHQRARATASRAKERSRRARSAACASWATLSRSSQEVCESQMK